MREILLKEKPSQLIGRTIVDSKGEE